jgi:hypothetical protein
MNIRWSEFIVALMVAAWLGLFTTSCRPVPPPEVVSGSTAESSGGEEAPLSRPGSAMEQQAEQGELAPPAHEVNPGVHHN